MLALISLSMLLITCVSMYEFVYKFVAYMKDKTRNMSEEMRSIFEHLRISYKENNHVKKTYHCR